jgi:PTH1 family peptidyl-tRNA hydrolase
MAALRRGGGSTLDYLVVGLGNPGSRYAQTRHNAGFMVVDRLAERAGVQFRSKYDGRFTEAKLGDARVALLEPETYMNLSGRPVQRAAAFYKLPPEAVIVVHDDIDLDFDRVRAKAGGGLKGHNGLRSLADSLGTRDFLRVRIGIGRPQRGDRRDVADWVLAPFEADEDWEPLMARGADCVEAILADGIDAAEARAF